jgi:hypothetical protein
MLRRKKICFKLTQNEHVNRFPSDILLEILRILSKNPIYLNNFGLTCKRFLATLKSFLESHHVKGRFPKWIEPKDRIFILPYIWNYSNVDSGAIAFLSTSTISCIKNFVAALEKDTETLVIRITKDQIRFSCLNSKKNMSCDICLYVKTFLSSKKSRFLVRTEELKEKLKPWSNGVLRFFDGILNIEKVTSRKQVSVLINVLNNSRHIDLKPLGFNENYSSKLFTKELKGFIKDNEIYISHAHRIFPFSVEISVQNSMLNLKSASEDYTMSLPTTGIDVCKALKIDKYSMREITDVLLSEVPHEKSYCYIKMMPGVVTFWRKSETCRIVVHFAAQVTEDSDQENY